MRKEELGVRNDATTWMFIPNSLLLIPILLLPP